MQSHVIDVHGSWGRSNLCLEHCWSHGREKDDTRLLKLWLWSDPHTSVHVSLAKSRNMAPLEPTGQGCITFWDIGELWYNLSHARCKEIRRKTWVEYHSLFLICQHRDVLLFLVLVEVEEKEHPYDINGSLNWQQFDHQYVLILKIDKATSLLEIRH